MVAFPLLILALAAGIYLLMKATREYLGPVYKILAWLVIILSLLGLTAHVIHGVHHFRHRHDHKMSREERIIIHDDGNGQCGMCMMGGGCKMVGDSIVMDKATCEKLMGKDSCDKICAQRGQCILSKDECMKMCGGEGKCMMMGGSPSGSCCMQGGPASGSCCMKDGKAPNGCCAKGAQGGEMKECCKKK